jgi:hypothetical protein
LNHINTRYWLCHGGFDIQGSKSKQGNKIKLKFSDVDYTKYGIIRNNINTNNNLVFYFNNNMSQIRWNDFNGDEPDTCNRRSGNTCNLFYIGNKSLFHFLDYLKIDFIIRGHNDDVSNAMILRRDNKNKRNKRNNNNKIEEKYIILNTKEFYDYYNLNENEENNVLNFGDRNNFSKFNDNILSIEPNKFNRKSIKIGKEILYPVITISNNSDLGRMQYSDSFLIIKKNHLFIIKLELTKKSYILFLFKMFIIFLL